MAGVNKAILIGHLGKDPEMKVGQSTGRPVTRFTLATTEKYGGEERTGWHNILCFDRLAEISNEYLTKGRQVYIEGRIQTRSREDENGGKRYTTEIIAGTMQMLGVAKVNQHQRPAQTDTNKPEQRGFADFNEQKAGRRPPPDTTPKDDPFRTSGYGGADIDDDSMPF